MTISCSSWFLPPYGVWIAALSGGTLRERLLYPLRSKWQRAQALAGRIGDGIGDRRGGRTLRAFAHAEETFLGAIEQHHLDLRHVPEMDDRIVRPRLRCDARAVVSHRFHQRPARGLDDAALDLVHDAIRVDDLPGIDRRHGAHDAHLAARAIDFDVGDHRHVTRQVLVLGEREPSPASAVTLRIWLPASALRGRFDHR